MERVRDLRLRCWLSHGAAEVPGQTVTVGAHTASLRFDRGVLDPATLQTGKRAGLLLRLPAGERVLRLQVEVTWLRAGELEVAAGVAWAGLTPASRGALDALVASYRHTVLVVTPDAREADRLAGLLAPPHHVARAAGVEQARAALAERAVSVLLLGRAVAEPARLLGELGPALRSAMAAPVLLGPHPEGSVEELLDLGRVFGALGRPLQDDVIQQVVHRSAALHELMVENERLGVELERWNERLKQENAYLRRRLTGAAGFEAIIGSSLPLQRSLAEIERVRRTDATVHIHGETGTGKELVARALHIGGPRAQGPFVAQNCGGIPEGLLQSVLFGHVKGAFTGADRAQPGVFQEANGGTLFLDEVAELSPVVQASLLRALQEREVVPVGSARPVKIDVRVVSASRKDLREEVRAGRFREDLFFRLMVVPLELPPLRKRTGDIAILAEHFLDLMCTRHGKRLRGLDAEAIRVLEGYPWPGNVRELENAMERAVVMAGEGEVVGPALLPERLRGAPEPGSAPSAGADGVFISFARSYDEAVEQLERAFVERALGAEDANLSRAARRLGVKRTRLFKIRARLGLDD